MSKAESPNNARILLVDDYEMVRVFLKKGLLDLGYRRVDEARDGAEALAKIKSAQGEKDPYMLVFCDWNMPEKTGIEVLKECRADQNLKGLPFIMVTAESEQDKVVEALKAGASDYIVKPIAPQILQKKMAKMMSKLNLGAAA